MAQWLDACVRLSRADADVRLSPSDLELLATASYMLGNDAAYAAFLERAHHGHLAAGNMRARFGVPSGSATTACSAVTPPGQRLVRPRAPNAR